jgi:hypothetical protein
MFLKFEHYELAISEVSHYGFLRVWIFERKFFNRLTKRF